MKRRIMIVDDHPVFRGGLEMMIGAEADLEVACSADSCARALDSLRAVSPIDLLILDISLGDGNGLELVAQIKEIVPPMPILVLSAHDERSFAERALKSGAMGYIMKTEPRERLLAGIREVLNGGMHWGAEVSQMLLRKMMDGEADQQPVVEELLSARELEIYRLIGEGLDTETIARRLFLSPKTVRAHRNNMMRKLKLKGSIQLYQTSFQWVRGAALQDTATRHAI